MLSPLYALAALVRSSPDFNGRLSRDFDAVARDLMEASQNTMDGWVAWI